MDNQAVDININNLLHELWEYDITAQDTLDNIPKVDAILGSLSKTYNLDKKGSEFYTAYTTPLGMASHRGLLTYVHTFLKRGASINYLFYAYHMDVGWFAANALLRAIAGWRLQTVLFLLNHGANAYDPETAFKPLNMIVKWYDVGSHPWSKKWEHVNLTLEIMDMLIKGGAPTDESDHSGATPLFLATAAGALPYVKQLLTARADVNKRCTKRARQYEVGLTPLLLAAKRDNVEIFNSLLQAGGDLAIPDTTGQSCEEIAGPGVKKLLTVLRRQHSNRALIYKPSEAVHIASDIKLV